MGNQSTSLSKFWLQEGVFLCLKNIIQKKVNAIHIISTCWPSTATRFIKTNKQQHVFTIRKKKKKEKNKQTLPFTYFLFAWLGSKLSPTKSSILARMLDICYNKDIYIYSIQFLYIYLNLNLIVPLALYLYCKPRPIPTSRFIWPCKSLFNTLFFSLKRF